MNSRYYRTLFALFAITPLFALFAITPYVRAAEPPPCAFNARLSTLHAIKNAPSGDYLSTVREELRVRKELLADIIGCAIREAQGLATNVRALPVGDSEIERAKAKVTSELDAATRYYESLKTNIVNLGIRGTQESAKNLKDWRGSNYEPATERAIALVLWVKNQNLFRVAENRLGQIKNTVSKLKLTEDDAVAPLVLKATDSVLEALRLNGEAKQAFNDPGEAGGSLILVKHSLDALSRAYQNFFELSEAIKKFFPR